jgi:spore coat polysaccharide biosynthesis predicted glycosyltransferase SpsG
MSMTLVVLIADGGAEAGLGHLSRCSALALGLRREGAAVRTLSFGLQEPIERYGVSWEPAAEPDPAGADAIVIDSYRATEELRLELASSAPLVAFADDERELAEATLIVRSGAGSGREGELAGLDYACLGPEYWSVPPHRIRGHAERVLVATGAADHASVGLRLATRLRDTLPDGEVTLVRGPYAPPIDVPEGIRIVSAPDSLFGLLFEADIVVSAAGQTMLETLAVGTPCLALVTAENQRLQADDLQGIGTLTVIDTVEQATTAAGMLVGDLNAREAQARAGRRAIDGRGAMRVASAVLELALTCSLRH